MVLIPARDSVKFMYDVIKIRLLSISFLGISLPTSLIILHFDDVTHHTFRYPVCDLNLSLIPSSLKLTPCKNILAHTD